MTLLEHAVPPSRLPETAEEQGYETIDVPIPSAEDLVLAYLKYRNSGGTPVRAWERRVRQLGKAATLPL